ncbi:hypothetical protein [Haloarcula amylovorans]|nr:hypothetical protein [Halomicroarcula amylolytica]
MLERQVPWARRGRRRHDETGVSSPAVRPAADQRVTGGERR